MFKQADDYAAYLLSTIQNTNRPMRIMEVCGTHTMAIARSGLKTLLPDWITLLSGPGCPICVTDESDIDLALVLAKLPKVILASYGDMMRVPGTSGTLNSERLYGADIRVIYSGQAALRLAKGNPDNEIVLVSVGFETTAPTTAVIVERAIKEGIKNFSILPLHKAMPPILRCLLDDPELAIDAFLLPGHVAAITGAAAFDFIAKEYKKPGVVAGFEPTHILEALCLLLLKQSNKQAIDIQYKAVRERGNLTAQKYLEKYFSLADCVWRGIGTVPLSGYVLREEFESFDAQKRYDLRLPVSPNTHCVCKDILKGRKEPPECEFFGSRCTPAAPLGPCMISEEGSCAAYYLQLRERTMNNGN
jgi:hydrogenase expression/formation protein HypD